MAGPPTPIAISWSNLRAHMECRQKSALAACGLSATGDLCFPDEQAAQVACELGHP